MTVKSSFILGAFAAIGLFVSGCSTVVEGNTQDVYIETPGANDAFCYLDNGALKYRVVSPGKARISTKRGDLTVRCLADGNREKTIVIPQGNPAQIAYANVATAGAGAVVDHFTGALYHYPEYIVVDFTNVPSNRQELPNYHKHIEQNPDLFGMEEFRPGRSALQRDAYDAPNVLQKREFLPGEEGASSITGFTESDGTADTSAVISAGSSGSQAEDAYPSDVSRPLEGFISDMDEDSVK